MRDFSPSCPEPTYEKGLLRTHTQTVLPEWIDYNGHMNVAYYTKAFDTAFDEVLEDYFGIGVSFVERSRLGPMSLQSNFFYLEELLEGEPFHVRALLVDCDKKRMHFFGDIIAETDGRRAAAFESLSMCVDLEARKSAEYPDWAQARMQAMMAAQVDVPRPKELGKAIGIRRKS